MRFTRLGTPALRWLDRLSDAMLLPRFSIAVCLVVVQTDDACGQVLAAIRAAGLKSNTLVVFSSDNGPERSAYARDRRHRRARGRR